MHLRPVEHATNRPRVIGTAKQKCRPLGAGHSSLRLYRLRGARPGIVVMPADTTTELSAGSDIVAIAPDVFISARSISAEQRKRQAE